MTGADIFLFSVGKAKIPSWGREKFPSGNLFVTTSDGRRHVLRARKTVEAGPATELCWQSKSCGPLVSPER